MAADGVVIEVGLNENRTRAENRHVPYTPEEIAAAARSCLDAGASIVHFHGRRGPEARPALSDPGPNLEAQRRITETTPLIAYPSYGSEVRVLDYYDIGTPAPERYAHYVAGVRAGVRFEVAPVDLGVLDVNARFDPAQGLVPSTGLLMNTGVDQHWILDFCTANGLKPHFTVFDTAHLQNLLNLSLWQRLGEPPTVVKIFLAGANANPRTLLFFRDRLHELLADRDLLWLPLVYGTNQLPLCTLSLSLGGHARIGIGDHPYRERGEPSSAELVEQVVTIARALGREPLGPEQTRERMGLAPLSARAGRPNAAGLAARTS